MALLYTALMFEDREAKERVFRNRFDAYLLDDDSFISTFRISKSLSKRICEELLQDLCPISGVRTALSVETQVLCALQFFATGSYQKAVGRDMMVALSQASVSRCIKKVAEGINKHLLKREISFPAPHEYGEIKRKFMLYSGFPGVIGAIDCTHVQIIAPPEPMEENYVNRKGTHSINVQLVCESNLKITNINAKYPGRNHDAFIWRHSELHDILEEEHSSQNVEKGWLLGDSGYPLEPWLMTPISNPNNPAEHRYNRAHIKGRNVIERLNGVLKSRFRCLSRHRVLNLNPTMASKVINACAVLHNLCLKHNIRVEEEDDHDDDDDHNDKNDFETIVQTGNSKAIALRKHIVENQFT